ncbi:hypothetical protein SEA_REDWATTLEHOG_111 [Gordonia phage RedWattleHog]|uniref:Uncharacterized protein n=1 Tax=Gordonia phage Stormageddon TaxID=2656541 RepID=A0A649VR27_9CAUD|nr:hypothetical protein KHQ86_gp190 [Gordonia phage Stormageddon]QGJ94970.1 hypothetical protein SEA_STORMAGEDDON_110 [Gordonia phage Stormageddon]QLF83614.1 hypothetical protein SEA_REDWATTLEHOG_111 [Gordonia phage RedWattleHog]
MKETMERLQAGLRAKGIEFPFVKIGMTDFGISVIAYTDDDEGDVVACRSRQNVGVEALAELMSELADEVEA